MQELMYFTGFCINTWNVLYSLIHLWLDFNDIDDVHISQTHGDEDNIFHMSLIFFMLCRASFYGVSATALNHLIKLLQYITDLFTDIGFLVLKGILEY